MILNKEFYIYLVVTTSKKGKSLPPPSPTPQKMV